MSRRRPKPHSSHNRAWLREHPNRTIRIRCGHCGAINPVYATDHEDGCPIRVKYEAEAS